MRVVLLHSPLVGPTTWAAVARQLRRTGHQVVVPDLRSAVTGDPPYHPALWRAASGAVHSAPEGGPLVLVGHSGAGPLLPGIAGGCERAVHALVYVDAGLPRPGSNWFERAPDDPGDHLRRLGTGGYLPPWDEWFEPGTLDSLIPQPRLRARFRAELPRLSMAFLAEPTPPASWSGRCGYLLLSEAYRPDAEEAHRNGWPVLEHRSHHLAMLTEPAAVAGAIGDLMQVLVKDIDRRRPAQAR